VSVDRRLLLLLLLLVCQPASRMMPPKQHSFSEPQVIDRSAVLIILSTSALDASCLTASQPEDHQLVTAA
jgi:hypothetical protein